MEDKPATARLSRRLAAWSIHLLSASGAVLALLALTAVIEHRWVEALAWLLVALVVDGIDGSLARAAGVDTAAGRIDGNALDLVIDYLTYVFVPALFMIEASLLPGGGMGLVLAGLILVSSLYVFARRDMKTADGYFRGFPALWNVVALYLFAANFGEAATSAIVVVLASLSFAPVHFVHPFRVRDFGPLLPAIALLWAGSTMLLIAGMFPSARGILLALSAASAALIVALGLWRSVRGPLGSPRTVSS